MSSIYGDEFQHVTDGGVVTIAELRKIIAEGKPVTFTPAMTAFVLQHFEELAYSYEAMTQYMLENGLLTPAIAKDWKTVYQQTKGSK